MHVQDYQTAFRQIAQILLQPIQLLPGQAGQIRFSTYIVDVLHRDNMCLADVERIVSGTEMTFVDHFTIYR